jgi:hypothetical protein
MKRLANKMGSLSFIANDGNLAFLETLALSDLIFFLLYLSILYLPVFCVILDGVEEVYYAFLFNTFQLEMNPPIKLLFE